MKIEELRTRIIEPHVRLGWQEKRNKQHGTKRITQEKLDELKHYINEYEAIVTAPRETTSDKSAATKKLAQLFNQLDSVLVDMDGLMNQFESTEADFYNSYKTARKIVDLGQVGKDQE